MKFLINSACDHKHLSPVNGNDIGLCIVLFIVLALASATGIGGGGLLIPMMMVISTFPTYYSVPLSVTSIVGGSITRFLLQVGVLSTLIWARMNCDL